MPGWARIRRSVFDPRSAALLRASNKCDRNWRPASFPVQARRLSMRDIPQHGGTYENPCIGIVRRRPSWHGINGTGRSRGADHGRASRDHRSRLALRSGLAHQSMGPLRPESAHLSSLPILGATAFPLASPSLAASSLAAPPRTSSPSSPRVSLVIGPGDSVTGVRWCDAISSPEGAVEIR